MDLIAAQHIIGICALFYIQKREFDLFELTYDEYYGLEVDREKVLHELDAIEKWIRKGCAIIWIEVISFNLQESVWSILP